MQKVLFRAPARRIFTAVIFALLLAGCGKERSGRNTETSGEGGKETRVVSTLRGNVEIPADPRRIADASGVSDILCIIGKKPVATADSDAYDYTRFPSYLEKLLAGALIIGYPMADTVDIEAVLAAEPDLIIINPRQEKAYESLSQIAPVMVIEPDVNDWRGDMRMIAALFSAEEAAEKWIAGYEAKAKTVGEAIRAKNGAEASYFSFLTGGSAYYLFTGAAYGDIFYNDLGLGVPDRLPEQNSISLPTASLEGLVEIRADYIIALASDQDRAALESSAVWNSISTVKNNRVIWLPQSPYFNQAYSAYGRLQLLDELQALLTQ